MLPKISYFLVAVLKTSLMSLQISNMFESYYVYGLALLPTEPCVCPVKSESFSGRARN